MDFDDVASQADDISRWGDSRADEDPAEALAKLALRQRESAEREDFDGNQQEDALKDLPAHACKWVWAGFDLG